MGDCMHQQLVYFKHHHNTDGSSENGILKKKADFQVISESFKKDQVP